MIYKTKTLSYETRNQIFWLLASTLIIFFVIYFFCIEATTRHIARRQELERDLATVSSNLGALEFSLIEKESSFGLGEATSLGLIEASDPLYVARQNTGSLSFNR